VRTHQPETVPTIRVNGLQFGYLEWGSGTPVLLFHGFPDTARTWDVIGPALAAAGFHAIAPFLRGYAPTDVPAKDTDSRTLAEDVLALAAAFSATRLVGHDWGAEAVYSAVGLRKFERLVTVAIPHRAAVRLSLKLVWALRHFATLRFPGAEARFARNDYEMVSVLCRRWSPTWNWSDADLEPVKNCFAAPGSLHAAIGYYRAADVRTPSFVRQPVTTPTLCIAGAQDPAAGIDLFERARKHFAAGCEIKSIPGGHFCHRESPQAFLEAVIPFLK
jgi:pimeloyl-ACP methyl ester carboxylesterase